jgi:hypothetical protein
LTTLTRSIGAVAGFSMHDWTIDQWTRAVDAARRDERKLEALIAAAANIDSALARGAQLRAKRHLRVLAPPESDSRGPGAPSNAATRVIPADFGQLIISGLEDCVEFDLDERALKSLLDQARRAGKQAAADILSSLIIYRARSARTLLLKLADGEISRLEDTVWRWLWSYAILKQDLEVVAVLQRKSLVPRALLDQLRALEAPTSAEGAHGWLYLLQEEGATPTIVKVGMTTKTVEQRVAQLNSSTSQHRYLRLVKQWPTRDPRCAESRAHDALARCRVSESREFFQIDIDEAVNIIDSVLREVD